MKSNNVYKSPRLSQAHAKLMLHDSVLIEDAIVTISLVECTMLNSSLLGSVSVLHSVFPADPQLEFVKQSEMCLFVCLSVCVAVVLYV